MYTTNVIEILNNQFRKVTKNKKIFSTWAKYHFAAYMIAFLRFSISQPKRVLRDGHASIPIGTWL